jgi:hypothetical protein
MAQRIETLTDAWPREKPKLGAPPLPHEHGAWVMLYAPMILAVAALWPAPALPVFCLCLATTGAYLARVKRAPRLMAFNLFPLYDSRRRAIVPRIPVMGIA